MNTIYIYGLKSILSDEMMYIGKTINPSQRLKQHRYAKSTNKELSNWIKSNNIEMIIIEKCDSKSWEEREKYWISFYGLNNLLNIHEGGNIQYGFKKYINRAKDKNIYEKIELIEKKETILCFLIKNRKRQNIKANKIADFIGISPALLSRLETGKSIPNIDYIEQYADYLGYELRLLKK